MSKRLRIKVLRVIKLNAYDRAFHRTNPFNLNTKDRIQLIKYMKVIKDLFLVD